MTIKDHVLWALRNGAYVHIVTDDIGDLKVREFVASITPGYAWARATIISSDQETPDGYIRVNFTKNDVS